MDYEEEESPTSGAIVKIPWHARMWPRAILDVPVPKGRGKLKEKFPFLGKSGVYVLYLDDIPLLHRASDQVNHKAENAS